MGHRWDIDKIHCYIDLSQNSIIGFINRVEIHTLISKDVSGYLKKYGFDFEITPLGGKGGGGGGDFIAEALRMIRESVNILATLISIFELVKAVFKFIGIQMKRHIEKSKPKVQLNFSLVIDEDPVYSNVLPASIERLIMLKHILDDICKKLHKKYSLFNFDYSFGISVYVRHFSISYILRAEDRNMFNNFRLMRLLKSFYIKNNTNITYGFTQWGFISRYDDKLKYIEKTRMRSPNKRYYLFLSTRVISDYFEMLRNFFTELQYSMSVSKMPPRG